MMQGSLNMNKYLKDFGSSTSQELEYPYGKVAWSTLKIMVPW